MTAADWIAEATDVLDLVGDHPNTDSMEDREFRDKAPTVLHAALDALEAVLGIHRRVGIYDECDCTDEQKQVGHEDIYEVGLTCNRLYDVCDECCRDDGYQTEECAACHKHTLEPTCPTIRAIREALGVES